MTTERINGLVGDDLISNDRVMLPGIEEVMQLLDGVNGLSPEEREAVRLSLLEQQVRAEDILRKHMLTSETHSGSDYLLFVAMLTLIALVFGFSVAKTNKKVQ
ncbi:uncharacterized protein LOC129616415 isoform X2 [Condylostylus longicornis]|uniref:uncharacterized protein LOC129616415 isoform X2 n=1 Tax=Condylostylus longicornis TaxID=2530218 RepID=UPI00244E22BD|nr:uncharacterized protein LOC129616415 isoform X2 [Condylostylus longicornis]